MLQSSLPLIFEAAVLAVFDVDAHTDFACVGRDGAPRVFPGDAGDTFTRPPNVWMGTTSFPELGPPPLPLPIRHIKYNLTA